MFPRSPLNLHVRTESGQPLGQVVNVEIDPETQLVTTYHVKPNRLVPDMVSSPLLIRASQVVRFDDDAMIVEDAVRRDPAMAPQPSA